MRYETQHHNGFGKFEESLNTVEKCLKKDHDIKPLMDTKVQALFKLGRYEDAYSYLSGKSEMASLKKRAGEFMVEDLWSTFRSGDKEEAAKRVVALAEKYPHDSEFPETKEKMLVALIDNTVIPLPKPLPHRQEGFTTLAASPVR